MKRNNNNKYSLINNNKNNPNQMILMQKVISNLYFFTIASMYFIISILPAIFWLVTTQNSPLDIIAIGFIFPGLAALVSCNLKFIESGNDIQFPVTKKFIEGYKNNFFDVIKFSFIVAVPIYLILANVNFFGEDTATGTIVLSTIFLSILILITTYKILVVTKFSFKTFDLLRVAIYCLIMHFTITLKILATYIAVFFIWPWLGDALFLFSTSVISYFIIKIAFPIYEDVFQTYSKEN